MKRLLLALLVFTVQVGFSTNHHATVAGSASNSGVDSTHGWSLAYAFSGSAPISPGDTVWIHGGTYSGQFTCSASGTAANPIFFRGVPGQRVTIDSGSPFNGTCTLGISCSYVWFWGLEIMSSATTKAGGDETYGNYSWPDNIGQPEGIVFFPTDGSSLHPGVKVIRCIVHDTKQGYSHWSGGINSEVIDCVFYDNGWYDINNDAHGHNWYIQTQSLNGTVKFTNNINERSYDNAFQVYGSGSTYGDSVLVDYNFFSQDGSNIPVGNGRNGFFGAGNLAHYDTYRNNVSYNDMGVNLLVCSGNGTPGSMYFQMINNLMWGASSDLTLQSNTSPTITGNKVYWGGGEGYSGSYPSNVWTGTKPSTWDTTIIHPFTYEKGAHIAVLNAAGAASKAVDFSGFLSNGDKYTVVDAQNYYGPPLASGTYSGGTVSLPLNSTATPAVVGNDPRQYHHTTSVFNAFVVMSQGTASLPAVPSAPTANAASSIQATSFQANWSAASGATGYDLDVATDPTFGNMLSGYNNLSVGNVNNLTVTGLTVGTAFPYGPGINADQLANTVIGGSAANKTTFSFQSKHTGALTNIRWYMEASAGYGAGTGGTILVALHPDSTAGGGHYPKMATTLASVTLSQPITNGTPEFPYQTFASPATLTAGTIYHLVFTNIDADPSDNYVSNNSLWMTTGLTPQQPEFADTVWFQMFMDNTMGGSWAKRGAGAGQSFTPILELVYGDGYTSGMGYMESWIGDPKTVSGTSGVRETFTVSGGNRTIQTVYIRLEKVSGSDALTLQLQTSGGSVLASASVAAASISASYGWVPFTFSSPVTMTSGTAYNLTLSCAGTSSYQLYPIRKGVSYSFPSTTYYADGYAQFNPGTGWTGWDQWGGSNETDGDLQFYSTGVIGTTFYYRVRASNSAGTSGNSNVITVSTSAPPPPASKGAHLFIKAY